MQKSETRRFLEEQFDKYDGLHPDFAEDVDYSEMPEEDFEEFADEYLQAPSSYRKEFWEVFKTLPPELRRYLHEREDEIERSLSHLNEELKVKHFLDEAFATKGCRHGFKTALDWIEKLIFAEEMLESSPRETLCHLAKAYGVDSDFCGKKDSKPDILEMKLALLLEGVQRLKRRFEDRERHYEEMAAAARAARKAKNAGFSPRGKAMSADSLEDLTTRQILERKFAELE